ncbi:hypothetical protein AAHZ94_16125 [Streptomyces sp. HSW2009]|uniref:hypothetical protein n=1 Tax=Streptomyces sp. HSW2009 TaxID=3142890 RepID=UPI0032ED7242
MRLVAYRSSDVSLLTGYRLPGELLGVRPAGWSDAAEPHRIADPWARRDERLYVVRDVAYVRYTDIDWASGRARLEIGPRERAQPTEGDGAGPEHAEDLLAELVDAAVTHGRCVLNLRRLHGWVTPAAGPPLAPLRAAGFVWEAVVPRGCRYEGNEVEREMWGLVAHG